MSSAAPLPPLPQLPPPLSDSSPLPRLPIADCEQTAAAAVVRSCTVPRVHMSTTHQQHYQRVDTNLAPARGVWSARTEGSKKDIQVFHRTVLYTFEIEQFKAEVCVSVHVTAKSLISGNAHCPMCTLPASASQNFSALEKSTSRVTLAFARLNRKR